jgi:hypothetical protein
MLQGVDRSIATVNRKKAPKLKYQTGNQLHEQSSFPRKRESSLTMDSRFRGRDELLAGL